MNLSTGRETQRSDRQILNKTGDSKLSYTRGIQTTLAFRRFQRKEREEGNKLERCDSRAFHIVFPIERQKGFKTSRQSHWG